MYLGGLNQRDGGWLGTSSNCRRLAHVLGSPRVVRIGGGDGGAPSDAALPPCADLAHATHRCGGGGAWALATAAARQQLDRAFGAGVISASRGARLAEAVSVIARKRAEVGVLRERVNQLKD